MNENFFVYIYKDKNDNIQYVGYGKNSERAVSHQTKTHNKPLEELIMGGEYTVHIAGPFDSEITARSVEAALISALDPFCNQKQEKKEWRFRPVGVKPELSFRLSEIPLQTEDLLKHNKQVLFVRISNIDFANRVGYDISSPPKDEDIVARVSKFWQLKKFIPKWIENPIESPSLLIGVVGSPGSQVIISSMEIDTNSWGDVEIHEGGRIEIPLKNPQQLDMHNLRGRKIDKSVGLKFGAIRPQFFKILKDDEELV